MTSRRMTANRPVPWLVKTCDDFYMYKSVYNTFEGSSCRLQFEIFSPCPPSPARPTSALAPHPILPHLFPLFFFALAYVLHPVLFIPFVCSKDPKRPIKPCVNNIRIQTYAFPSSPPCASRASPPVLENTLDLLGTY